jgi:uncharacterized membrane protein
VYLVSSRTQNQRGDEKSANTFSAPSLYFLSTLFLPASGSGERTVASRVLARVAAWLVVATSCPCGLLSADWSEPTLGVVATESVLSLLRSEGDTVAGATDDEGVSCPTLVLLAVDRA